MTRARVTTAVVLGILASSSVVLPQGASVTVRNPIALARPAETVVLTAAQVRQALAIDDLRRVRVRDDAGQEVLAQAIDANDDGTFDELVFQADFAPSQTRAFSLAEGDVRVYTRDQFRAYGRFVRERRDDFVWENDRVAHRMYGEALETWAQEPLLSSAVDIWLKRTRRLVANEWYMVDDYHRDHGEGADMYSAGRSRGCGGNGIWAGGRLHPSSNFRHSRVLANGPIRVMFELTYETWNAAGTPVGEIKRITLDAGSNLSRFESHYKTPKPADLAHAVGIKKNAGAVLTTSRELGLLSTWEPNKADNSQFGCGVVMAASLVEDFPQDDLNYLTVAKVPPGSPAVYYAGFGWNRSGDFAAAADWVRYLEEFAQRLRAPLEIAVRAPR
jgi:hypothetical protein